MHTCRYYTHIMRSGLNVRLQSHMISHLYYHLHPHLTFTPASTPAFTAGHAQYIFYTPVGRYYVHIMRCFGVETTLGVNGGGVGAGAVTATPLALAGALSGAPRHPLPLHPRYSQRRNLTPPLPRGIHSPTPL